MASGKASKASVTLLTTQPGVGLLSSAVVEDPAWAAKINSLIPGGRPLFTASNKEESSPPDGLIAALVDGYVGIFLSVTNGFALMGDVGFNIIKFEHVNVALAWGARVPAAAVLCFAYHRCRERASISLVRCAGAYADTGVNIGKKGGRLGFLGFGAELKLKEKEDEAADRKLADVCGAGVSLGFLKVKLAWGGGRPKAKEGDDTGAPSAAPTAADPAVALASSSPV